MAEIKGLRELNIGFSNIVRPFGINGMVNGEDFQWRPDRNIIEYTLAEFDYRQEWLREFILLTFDYEVENDFMITLFHEIGHSKTYNNLTKEEDDYCNEVKAKIYAIANDEDAIVTVDEEKAYQFEYWNLPDEYLATQWAIEYIKENPDYVNDIWDEINRLLFDFYEINEVTDDDV